MFYVSRGIKFNTKVNTVTGNNFSDLQKIFSNLPPKHFALSARRANWDFDDV